MRFVDEVEIDVTAGDGGRGCAAFRREAHVSRGGPAGGDGGRGGDVIVRASQNHQTLLDLRYQRHYRAERGHHGLGNDKHGRRGTPCTIDVPCGTLVYDINSGELLADLTEDGAEVVVACGGRGGRGNRHFVTPTQRAPREAEPGEPGQRRHLRLELKLLAEVGLVGLPNAGKSTLISRLSAARPRVADYPFTTLVPMLGVVRIDTDRSFVMADIPGLIEGAADGVGLGKRFLRHIERAKVLVFLLDDRHQTSVIGEQSSLGPVDDLRILRNELAQSDPALLDKPNIIVLNKTDLLTHSRRQHVVKELSEATSEPVVCISASTGQGLPPLLRQLWQRLHNTPQSS